MKMKTSIMIVFIGTFLIIFSCENVKKENYPVALKKPFEQVVHERKLIDNYFWLRDINDPNVKKYLNQENDYLSDFMKNTDSLQKCLYDEILVLTDENKQTQPYYRNNYWYKTSYQKGKNHPIHVRWRSDTPKKIETYFDQNKWVKHFNAYTVYIESISKDNKKLLFSVDKTGNDELDIYILDIETQKVFPDKLERAYSATWANDNKTVFYIKDDSITNRSFQIYRHVMGESESDDFLLYEEKDETFSLGIRRSTSYEYIFLYSRSMNENEIWYLDANQPNEPFKIFSRRQDDVEYELYHANDSFYILTNEDAVNNKLMKTDVKTVAPRKWEEVIGHKDSVVISNVDVFKEHLVVTEKINGLPNIHVYSQKTNEDYYIPFDEETYYAETLANFEFETNRLRYTNSSFTSPQTDYEWNLDTKEKKILKNHTIDGYHKQNYQSEKIWAKSRDGTSIPISLVYNKKKFKKNGTNPILIQGYGAYGITMRPFYNKHLFPLLDRGFVYAIPHVRGGSYLGFKWYKDGKLLNKKNTFKDFIDCTEHLITESYGNKDQVVARGGSAGGLLMGAIANIQPELYSIIISEVPFVDVINTMLDESIPLTIPDYKEWGDPKEKEYFEYMLSYSPYDNVRPVQYPKMLFTTGIMDENVPYWEAAKMVAKLRVVSKNPNDIFLKTNMESGHRGASGRYLSIEEEAYIQAFIIKQIQRKNKTH